MSEHSGTGTFPSCPLFSHRQNTLRTDGQYTRSTCSLSLTLTWYNTYAYNNDKYRCCSSCDLRVKKKYVLTTWTPVAPEYEKKDIGCTSTARNFSLFLIYAEQIPYNPNLRETSRRCLILSLMYPSLAFSEDHRPCFDIILSLTLFSAAALAPPALKPCKPKSIAGNNGLVKPKNILLIVEYDNFIKPCALCPCLVFANLQNK